MRLSSSNNVKLPFWVIEQIKQAPDAVVVFKHHVNTADFIYLSQAYMCLF